MKPRICISIPFYLNNDSNNYCYRQAFKYYSSLGIPLNLCGSEGVVSKQFCKPFLNDWTSYVEVPQSNFCISSGGDENLRKKFNDSLLTHGKDYEWYALVGADDICEIDFGKLPTSYHPMMMGISSDTGKLYIRDFVRNESYRVELQYAQKYELLPGINLFNNAAMRLSDWKPYQLNGCETGAELYFREHAGVVGLNGSVTMLKCRHCLNNTSKIKRRHKIFQLTTEEQIKIERF